MRILLLTVLSGLLFLSCRQHIQTDEAEFKQIYSDLLAADSLKGKYYLVDSIDNFDKKTVEEAGTTYSITHYDPVENGVWNNPPFDSLVIISDSVLDAMPRSRLLTESPSHYRFSLPYFSKDKQSFVIYYSHYCGNLCAEYSLRLYRKVNGKWTFVEFLFKTVS